MRQGLNRNQIKYIAVAAMLIDHIAWAFVPTETPLGELMHFFGRLTGPTMACLLAEGYLHTRSVPRYAGRLFLFALLSWGPFCWFETSLPPVLLLEGRQTGLYLASFDKTLHVQLYFGVIYTLFISLLAIWLLDRGRGPLWLRVLGVAGLCWLSRYGDWPVTGVLYALTAYLFHRDAGKKWAVYCLITAVWLCIRLHAGGLGRIFQVGAFLTPLVLGLCYNGQPGSRRGFHKWFFYWFYPAHLALLALLKVLL